MMKNDLPLVSCLCATHGRFSVLQEAVACFMHQAYPHKELIILNNHPVPIVWEGGEELGIKVINSSGWQTLADVRAELFGHANGELVRTWDDDDLYLPWAIGQGVSGMICHPEADVWKPEKSWSWRVDKDVFKPNANNYEASWTMRWEFVHKHGYLPRSGGNEHKPLLDAIASGKAMMVKEQVGLRLLDYVYRWGTDLCRISGTLNHETMGIQERTARWMRKNDDHGAKQPLTPAPVYRYFSKIMELINERERQIRAKA